MCQTCRCTLSVLGIVAAELIDVGRDLTGVARLIEGARRVADAATAVERGERSRIRASFSIAAGPRRCLGACILVIAHAVAVAVSWATVGLFSEERDT